MHYGNTRPNTKCIIRSIAKLTLNLTTKATHFGRECPISLLLGGDYFAMMGPNYLWPRLAALPRVKPTCKKMASVAHRRQAVVVKAAASK